MKKLLFVFPLALMLAGCPEVEEAGAVSKPAPPEVVATPTPVAKASSVVIEAIKAVPVGSACANYNFVSRNPDGSIRYRADGKILSNQGKPKAGFLKGISMSYARAYCRKATVYEVAGQPLASAAQDALSHYSVIVKREQIPLSTHDERMLATFSLMVGSGAMESSWNACAGRDPGASNYDGETAEGGWAQTSYNSRIDVKYDAKGKKLYVANPTRMSVYNAFKADQSGCYADLYGKCPLTKNHGTGEGERFQTLSKSCPGFTAAYHALMVRMKRSHYGPINQQYAPLTRACFDMFAAVKKLIDDNPSVCQSI